MIKLIRNNEIEQHKTRYKFYNNRFYNNRCNCCNKVRDVNILEIRADESSGGTVILLCDECLKKLGKEIDEKIR